MTTRPPDFDDLVGDGVEGAERERLRRVHDLLVEVGPPPDLSSAAPPDPSASVVPLTRQRSGRRRALLALAAALAVAAVFTLGLVVADDERPSPDRVVALTGPSGASASLDIYDVDEAGNWPMLIDVRGLPPAADRELYQLWLTRDGKPVALCGSFLTEPDGTAVVSMNAPWRLDDFDGWVVVERGSTTPLLTT
jgi:Anti-sigma-K factor rskA